MPNSTSWMKRAKRTGSFLGAAMFLLLAPPSTAQEAPSNELHPPPGAEIRITLPMDLPGTQVRLDGVLLDASHPHPTTGGVHAIRIEAEGASPVESTLVLSAGRNHLLQITTLKRPPPPVEIATFATAALGAALLISSVILEQTLDFDDPQRGDNLLIGMMGGAGLSLAASGALAANRSLIHDNEPYRQTFEWRLVVLTDTQR